MDVSFGLVLRFGLGSFRVDRLDIRQRLAQAAQAALQRHDVGRRELAGKPGVMAGGRPSDRFKRGVAARCQNDVRRTEVIGVIALVGGAFFDQEIGDPLHVLPGDAEHARDLRHGVRPAGRGAKNLPPRLGLADGPGDRFALIAEAARDLVNVRDDKRNQRLGAGLSFGLGLVVRVHGSILS
jgi:hypothetical protein